MKVRIHSSHLDAFFVAGTALGTRVQELSVLSMPSFVWVQVVTFGILQSSVCHLAKYIFFRQVFRYILLWWVYRFILFRTKYFLVFYLRNTHDPDF
jgi:hypothetical protein